MYNLLSIVYMVCVFLMGFIGFLYIHMTHTGVYYCIGVYMPEHLYRAQILLEPEQHRRLVEIARKEGRSISEVTRRAIRAGLLAIQNQDEVWQKRMEALAALRQIREGSQPYSGDLVNEGWEKRDAETGNSWSGQ